MKKILRLVTLAAVCVSALTACDKSIPIRQSDEALSRTEALEVKIAKLEARVTTLEKRNELQQLDSR